MLGPCFPFGNRGQFSVASGMRTARYFSGTTAMASTS